eukprot:GILI01009662.1.p1 GENE.GILI01009662.1~~GILI01009662.1.p1  ORF type:complete len:329 (-),score=26.98 GILI01009662.1:63-1007(-)
MADAEERFLKSRQQREEARTVKTKGDDNGSGPSAREEFMAEVRQLESDITTLLSKNGGIGIEGAADKCRTLQQLITSANEMLALPTHEQRSLNTLLSTLLSKISEARSNQKPAKKFGFSSKSKLVATQQADHEKEEIEPANNSVAAKEETASGEVFTDLNGQVIFVRTAKAVFIRRCSNCTVYALPTDGSLFISDCDGCTVYCASHQLRVKSSVRLSLYTWCTSRPVIESCSEMLFGGYDAWQGLLESEVSHAEGLLTHAEWATKVGHFKDLDWAQKSYTQVDDFHWLKQSQSPNWALIPKDQQNVSMVKYPTP